ncbi:titin-like [Hexamita inflata]|uniref:Titin-like n=1 Tax=Hexamita inflata TaxID=28002 RepID=A0AA86QKT5_9EUKA|nr:titin-like [Hexamita inflata]
MSDNDDLIHTSNNSYNTSYQLNNSFDKLQYKVQNHSFSPQLSLKTRIPVNPFLKERIVNEIIQEAKQREFDIKQLYSEMFEMRKQANIQLSDEEKIKRLNERDQAIIDVREQRKQKLQQIQFQKQLEQLEKEKVEQLMYDRANKRQQEIKQEQKRVKELQIQQIQQQQIALEQAELQNKQKYESKIAHFNQLRREALLQQELLREQEAVSEEGRKKQMYEENQIRIRQQAEMKRKREEESERQKLLQQEQYRLQNEERKRKLEKLRLEEEQKQQEELERKRQHEAMIQMERDKIAQELQVWLEKQKQLKVIYKNVDEERLAVAQKTAEITAQRKRQQELEKQLQEEEHQRLVQQQLEEEEKARQELLAEKERAEREKREHQESVLLQSTENEGFVKLLEDVALIKDEVNREVAEFEAAKPHADEFGRFHVVNLALIIPPPPIAQLESVPEFESVREKMKTWIGKLHGMFEAFSRQQLQLCNSRMQSIDLVLRLLVKMKQLVLLTACVGDVLYFDQKFAYLVDCQYLMVEQQTDQQILKRVRQQYKEECGQRLKELKQQFKQNSKNEQALPAIQKAIAVNQALQMEMRNVKDVLQLEMIVNKYKPQLK